MSAILDIDRRAFIRASLVGGAVLAFDARMAIAATAGVLVYLLSAPASKPEPPPDDRGAGEPVRVTAPYLVRVEPNTPLAAKLQTADVAPTRISAPGFPQGSRGPVPGESRGGRRPDDRFAGPSRFVASCS